MRPSQRFTALLALLLVLPPVAAWAGYIDHFARPDDVGAFKAPNRGPSRVLVVPVINERVTGDRDRRINVRELREFFEGASTPAPSPTPTGSPVPTPTGTATPTPSETATPTPMAEVADFPTYWRRMSRGALQVEAEVVDSVRLPGCPFPPEIAAQGCEVNRTDASQLFRAVEVVDLVLERLEREQDTDFTRYDIGGPDGEPDGWIDGLIMITNFGANDSIAGIALPVGLLTEEGPIVRDGIQINSAAIARDVWVGLHEYGHILGFADLYDEYNLSTNMPYSLMSDSGLDGQPALLDAFSRVQIGWADLREIRGEETVTIPPVLDSGVVYKLGQGREYFLVENRGPNDPWDGYMSERGLAVWHVNERAMPGPEDNSYLTTLLQCPNCSPWEPMLMLEQADGRFDLQMRDRLSDADDLFRDGDALLPDGERGVLDGDNVYLTSDRYDGIPTGASITGIDVESEAPGIVVTLAAPTEAPDPCLDVQCAQGLVCEAGSCVQAPRNTPAPSPTGGETPAPSEGRGGGGGGGGCAQTSSSAWWGLVALWGLLAWRRSWS